METKHTKYTDLPMCLRCKKCEVGKWIPCRTVSGDYGFFYSIGCTDETVTCFGGPYGGYDRSFWYDPNTQHVWVDGAGGVNDRPNNMCGKFTPEYWYEPDEYKLMVERGEMTKEQMLEMLNPLKKAQYDVDELEEME